MSFYGYDPAQYKKDYSGVGQAIGQAGVAIGQGVDMAIGYKDMKAAAAGLREMYKKKAQPLLEQNIITEQQYNEELALFRNPRPNEDSKTYITEMQTHYKDRIAPTLAKLERGATVQQMGQQALAGTAGAQPAEAGKIGTTAPEGGAPQEPISHITEDNPWGIPPDALGVQTPPPGAPTAQPMGATAQPPSAAEPQAGQPTTQPAGAISAPQAPEQEDPQAALEAPTAPVPTEQPAETPEMTQEDFVSEVERQLAEAKKPPLTAEERQTLLSIGAKLPTRREQAQQQQHEAKMTAQQQQHQEKMDLEREKMVAKETYERLKSSRERGGMTVYESEMIRLRKDEKDIKERGAIKTDIKIFEQRKIGYEARLEELKKAKKELTSPLAGETDFIAIAENTDEMKRIGDLIRGTDEIIFNLNNEIAKGGGSTRGGGGIGGGGTPSVSPELTKLYQMKASVMQDTKIDEPTRQQYLKRIQDKIDALQSE